MYLRWVEEKIFFFLIDTTMLPEPRVWHIVNAGVGGGEVVEGIFE